MGSISIPTTSPAPNFFAASARIPLPVPRSTRDQPALQPRANSSSKRSDIAVVACSPVPKATPAGITKLAGRLSLRTLSGLTASRFFVPLNTVKRFPIFSFPLSAARVNRLSQSGESFSALPPSSDTKRRAPVFDRQTISISIRLRSGLDVIESNEPKRACNDSSRAFSHAALALFRHRYILVFFRTPVWWPRQALRLPTTAPGFTVISSHSPGN